MTWGQKISFIFRNENAWQSAFCQNWVTFVVAALICVKSWNRILGLSCALGPFLWESPIDTQHFFGSVDIFHLLRGPKARLGIHKRDHISRSRSGQDLIFFPSEILQGNVDPEFLWGNCGLMNSYNFCGVAGGHFCKVFELRLSSHW